MKNKAKTHKGLTKRVKITGSGKVTRDRRRYRNSRISRMDGRASNTDKKNLELSDVTSKKVKKLLNI